jgi:hypothetical protein
MKKIFRVCIIIFILTIICQISYKFYFEDRQLIAKYYGYYFAYTLDSDLVNRYAISALAKDTVVKFEKLQTIADKCFDILKDVDIEPPKDIANIDLTEHSNDILNEVKELDKLNIKRLVLEKYK